MYLETNEANNKRIAKNVVFLYVRMLFMMFISFYTSRVVLNTLGVNDYGIYSVIGGFVAMFGILSNSLSVAISRFITYELGKNNLETLQQIFSSAIIIQVLMSIGILIIAEIGGYYFLNYHMNFAPERFNAVFWVFQFSIITFVINLISIPYNAVIMAHEHMSAFAYISMINALGTLIVAWSISISKGMDTLVLYSGLLCLLAIIVRCIYRTYCKHYFMECKFCFNTNTTLIRKIFSFAGWNFIGASSGILRDQGINILFNLFYGLTVNAAQGIAMQVKIAVSNFANNFISAINPQITKTYATNNNSYLLHLVMNGERFALYLLIYITIPILFETDYLLKVWLRVVPDYTVSLVRLVIIYVIVEAISYTLITVMLATGRIRNYQLLVGGCQMLHFPMAYLLLKMGCSPEVVVFSSILIAILCFILRLYMLHAMISFPVFRFLHVIAKFVIVYMLSCIVPFLIVRNMSSGFVRLFITLFLSLIVSSIIIFFVGCSANERSYALRKISNYGTNQKR